MAVNLRLDEGAVRALRETARRSGRSQQEILREAVDRHLGLGRDSERNRHVALGLVRPPTPFRSTQPALVLDDARTTMDLLDRDDE